MIIFIILAGKSRSVKKRQKTALDYLTKFLQSEGIGHDIRLQGPTCQRTIRSVRKLHWTT
jgi:hypothetical protein